MNLLTDIVHDVAVEMNIHLSQYEMQAIQQVALDEIVRAVALKKQAQIKRINFPWIDKSKEPQIA